MQMPAPNPIFAPLLNLVHLNITDPAPQPGLNWYNENATGAVSTATLVVLEPPAHAYA